jgi:glycosyltransferase involved in cell wall biosynthesis
MVTNMYPTAAAPDDGTPVADELAGLRFRGWHVELLHVPREGGSRRVYLGLRSRVRSLVVSVAPEIVVVMYGGVMADVVTRAVREVPVVVTFRGTDLLGGRGKDVVHGLSRRYGVIASRRAARRAAGIVVKSRNLLHALPSTVDRSRAWIVSDGVDLDRFAPRDRDECRAELGWDPGRRHVLFPGAADRPEKRFALAQAAVALVDGDIELHALSGVPHRAVATWLNACDAVLLTSAHEGSPNVVKEALACNASVVSVDVGDVREWIADVDACALADATPVDLAEKLAGVLSRGRSTRGRERVQEVALPRIAEKLSEIYAAVARGSPVAETSRAA